MKRYMRYVFGGSIILLLFVGNGCRKNRLEPTTGDAGLAYYPIAMGNTWVYQVDSIHYNAFNQSNPIDTFQFYVKYEVSDTVTDNNGVRNSVISCYRSSNPDGGFVFNRSFTRRIVDYRAESTDSNVRVVELLFPPVQFKYWDANAFNTKETEEAEIVEHGSKETIGSETYDSTIHVLQRDDDFRTLKRYGMVKYAKHTGMVFTEQINWTKKTINDPDEIPNGYEYMYTLIRFEK